MYDVIQALD